MTTCAPCTSVACPRPQGVAGPMGYLYGSSGCCKFVCGPTSLHKVSICMVVNAGTEVQIQQGCVPAGATGSVGATCPVSWASGKFYNTEGKLSAKIHWDRMVGEGSFIRVRLCATNSCDTTDCFGDQSDPTTVTPVYNQLTSFKIDGYDIKTSVIQYIADNGGFGTASCIVAACANAAEAGGVGATGPCCSVDDWSITQLPLGTVIIVGPIGQINYSDLLA